MTRASRVPYHQNVYDLLQIEPGECPDARRMIEEHEAVYGPLPASVREWYLVPNVAPLRRQDVERPYLYAAGTIWQDQLPHDNIGENHWVRTLDEVLGDLAANSGVVILSTVGYYTWTWYVLPDESDDPPVWVEPDQMDRAAGQDELAASFATFVSGQVAENYASFLCPHAEKQLPHRNRLWLRVPDEPFQPPVIDFLIDRFGEPARSPRPGNVTTYTWRPAGGTVRVTADEPTLTGGLSAWWLHAETPERLAEFAELLLPWGTLRDTLKADTDGAREVLQRVRGM